MVRWCLLSLALLALVVATLPAAPAPLLPKVPRALLKKRLEAAVNTYRGHLTRMKGFQGKPSELVGWSERWLGAELPLCDNKAQRFAALEAHVKRTRHVERMLDAMACTGQGRRVDVDAATYYRIQAEIRYFEATGKEAPPPVKGDKDDGAKRPAILGPIPPERK